MPGGRGGSPASPPRIASDCHTLHPPETPSQNWFAIGWKRQSVLVGRNPLGLQGPEAPQSIRFAFGTVVVLMSLSLPPFVGVLEADCGFIWEYFLRIRLEILLSIEKNGSLSLAAAEGLIQHGPVLGAVMNLAASMISWVCPIACMACWHH